MDALGSSVPSGPKNKSSGLPYKSTIGSLIPGLNPSSNKSMMASQYFSKQRTGFAPRFGSLVIESQEMTDIWIVGITYDGTFSSSLRDVFVFEILRCNISTKRQCLKEEAPYLRRS